ncbi:hypothetical protein [Crenothrix polyspora]|uniref:Surface antigen domain-containing protein n=1 Tax=Crenothrix polyspora TaxID=360316 RepID=A0A1R4HEL8_9GAMM|nr:hypothetical protein [Crenothrix polyspora]SJM94340.1 conserved exported hypothetical protein [Crenothrix polyspora]
MKLSKTLKITLSLATTLAITGCMGGGGGMYGNNGGDMYGNNGGMYGNAGNSILGSVANSALGGGVSGAVLSAIIQSMGSNVLNGQIGSQVSQADQNFRLQQLGSAVNSGAITQAQQWTNPQTGNTLALNPIGQQNINPQTQQKCQNLQESAVLPNGERITETRLACQNPQTGRWNLVK